jgi:hypothetical protein
MKTLSILILLLTSCCGFGQNSNTLFFTGSIESSQWTYADYIKNNVKKVEAYSYKIKNKGKITKDSLLLYRREIDKDSNKIFGINCNDLIQLHGPKFFLTGYKFETIYNNKGQVIMELDEPIDIEKKVEFGSVSYHINKNETLYEYDNNNKLIKKTYIPFNNYYDVSKYTKDTFHLLYIQKKIDEYVYNDKGLEIMNYETVDSSRYLPTKHYKPDSSSVTCSYCHSRYLNGDKTYNENGKLKVCTWYTTEGKIHTKKYYYYDDNNNLIKQVDSTGWYFTTILPYWESTTTYEYSDTGKIVTKINNTEARFGSATKQIVTKYDSKNQIVSECSANDSTEICTNYFYTYDKERLTSVTSVENNKNKLEKYFSYNLPRNAI